VLVELVAGPHHRWFDLPMSMAETDRWRATEPAVMPLPKPTTRF
jgi:hypothetical protein